MARRGDAVFSTPTTRDAESPAKVARGAGSLARGNELIEPLALQVLRMFPTPTAGDAKDSGSRNTAGSKAHPGVSLTDVVVGDGGTGRAAGGPRLNPDWEEGYLMRWPVGWTALGPLPSSEWRRWLEEDPWAIGPGEFVAAPTTTVTDHRRQRVKAIGNGQVPVQAAVAWGLLLGQR